jgi:hypothetical protein
MVIQRTRREPRSLMVLLLALERVRVTRRT